MRDITCDGDGSHRLRRLFNNWTVFGRDCERERRGIPVVAPDEMVFAFQFRGEETTLTDARIGNHDAEITPELRRRLIEDAKTALGIKRERTAQIRIACQEAAATK